MKDVKVFFNQKKDIKAFSGYDPEYNNIIVSFRGAISKKNWIEGINFFLK